MLWVLNVKFVSEVCDLYMNKSYSKMCEKYVSINFQCVGGRLGGFSPIWLWLNPLCLRILVYAVCKFLTSTED